MSSRQYRKDQRLRRKLEAQQAARAEPERAAGPEGRPLDHLGWDAANNMERLAYMRQVLASLESDISLQVDLCRDEGVPWVTIGRVFGITGEGARKRWAIRD